MTKCLAILLMLPSLLWADTSLRGAQRIITLSPHLADLVYSAGVEDKLIGVVRHTTPALMQDRTVVGDAFSLNIEQVLRLRPDAVLVWKEGTPRSVVEQLKALGLNVHSIPTKTLEDIPLAIAGLSANPRLLPEKLSSLISGLKPGPQPRRVFIQFGNYPSYTLNGTHILSEGLARCGFINVFAGLIPIAPQVDLEMVVRNQPDVILAITDHKAEVQEFWQRYLPSAKVIYGDSNTLSQPDADMVYAIQDVCRQL